MKKLLTLTLAMLFVSTMAITCAIAVPKQNAEYERQGCCSHHGGVCGCANGRAKCCDGSLSPSCGC